MISSKDVMKQALELMPGELKEEIKSNLENPKSYTRLFIKVLDEIDRMKVVLPKFTTLKNSILKINKKNHSKIYEDILESKMKRLVNWMDERDGISYDKTEKKLIADPDKIMQDEEEIKKYKTPKKLQEGNFKLYLRDDENLNLVIKLEDETLNWLIDLDKYRIKESRSQGFV